MKILLVTMPFSGIRPALGLSLLKSHLEKIGCETRIAYLNQRFAQKLGSEAFTYIADHAPPQSLAGDWVFSPCLFGPRDEADREYIAAFRERFGMFSPGDEQLAMLQRAREMANDFIQDCLADVQWNDYAVVGFTSTFTQQVASLALARRLKERNPEQIVVFGGANCEDRMGLALHEMFPYIDYVCSGEADNSFPHLIEALRSAGDPSAIAGVISRRGGKTYCMNLLPDRVKDLDALPFPNFDDYFEQFSGGSKMATGILMETSRGCWWGQKHHCTFCGLNGTAMAFRSKSADRVLEEITEQTRKYQPTHIEMVDNILNMRYFRDLLPELKRQQLKLSFFYETKANLTKAQVLDLCYAGVTSIQPGIESFSTEILRSMRKGTTALQNIQLLKWCKEMGMKAYWNLLYGFPGENEADYLTMADTIDSIVHLHPPQGMGPIRLDRFSPNFIHASELGLCNVRPDRSYGYIYDRPQHELMDLAYYFEYDYVDQRRPREYVMQTERAMRRWYAAAGSRGLIYVDHGDRLAIWDFRPSPVKRLTVLEGNERALYLYCDSQRSLGSIVASAREWDMTEDELYNALDCLLEARHMIKLDEHYLSLAVAKTASAAERSTVRSAALAF